MWSQISAVRTLGHEIRVKKRLFDLVIERNGGNVHGRTRLCEIANTRHAEQVVRESDSVAIGDLLDLMLAVAVEGGPTYGVLLNLGGTPIEDSFMAGMADDKLATFMMAGKADDQRSELSFRAGSVDVGLEEAGRASIDLN
jgi:hypothetical protein